jgi:hypothetical protein
MKINAVWLASVTAVINRSSRRSQQSPTAYREVVVLSVQQLHEVGGEDVAEDGRRPQPVLGVGAAVHHVAQGVVVPLAVGGWWWWVGGWMVGEGG